MDTASDWFAAELCEGDWVTSSFVSLEYLEVREEGGGVSESVSGVSLVVGNILFIQLESGC